MLAGAKTRLVSVKKREAMPRIQRLQIPFLVLLIAVLAITAVMPGNVYAGVATPRVDISVDTYGLPACDVDIEYSEAVTGLTQSDFYITNASITSFTGSGTSYTLTLQPTLGGRIDIYVGPFASRSVSTGDYSRGFQRHVDRNQTRPTAQFMALPLSGCIIPHTVFFTDRSLDTGIAVLDGPDIWQYDFGDGNRSTLQNPVHHYTAYGTYTVELTTTQVYSGYQDRATETIIVDGTRVRVTVSVGLIGRTIAIDAVSTTDGTISVASGAYTDAVGNPNADGSEMNSSVTMTIDTQSKPGQPFWMLLSGSRAIEASSQRDHLCADLGTPVKVSENTLFGSR